MSQDSLQFKTFDVELYFARRLGEHGKRIFSGLSDPTITKDRIRQAIIDAHLDCTIIGRAPSGKPETYAASFQRFYGTPLHEPKTMDRSTARKSVRKAHSPGNGEASATPMDGDACTGEMQLRPGDDGVAS